MEKFRVGLFLFLLLVLAVITFSLTKSWNFYDTGYEVTVVSTENKNKASDKDKEKENVVEPTSELDLEDGNGKIFWKQFYFYPVGLVTETGGIGPEGITSHARNLFSLNLKTGSTKKLFPRDVYVWDYFTGEFSRKIIANDIDEPKEDSLSVERKLVLIAATLDSNKDGVLNHKDYKRVFLYDPDKELMIDILPFGYHYRKLIFNTAKNTLSMIVRKVPVLTAPEKGKGKKVLVETTLQEIYTYDLHTSKGVLASPFE